ncbi:MAG: sigma-70 family RNA polymerase sigma factor [Phycisphaerae bacterium]|nr:sigma-70 family RNA polymerase sigma factor [Phycisphaerae bacterium]
MTQEMKLLQAAQAGNTAAFEQIVQNYQSLVCAITYSGTGRVEISEELAQETFLSAWKNLQQLTELGKFRAWLCSIARNMLNSHYRKKKMVSLDSVDTADLSDQAACPADHLIHQEEHTMLEQALMRIPAEYREPMVMYYRQEKSTRDVAEALGLNESTVRTRLHRARHMLREEIAARLERTIERTGPDKAFTQAVMVAVGGVVAGMSASMNTAVAAHSSGTCAATSMKAVLSTVTAKVILSAAGIVITAGAVFFYQNRQQPEPSPASSIPGAVAPAEQTLTVSPVRTDPVSGVPGPLTEIVIETPDISPAVTPDEPAPVLRSTHAQEETEYVFEPRGVLSGLVTDRATGLPVAGAQLVIYGLPSYNDHFVTDANGFYHVDWVRGSGQYQVVVSSKDHVSKPDINDDYKISIAEDQQAVAHFQLERACFAEFWVKDEQDNPIEGARVRVIDPASKRTKNPSQGRDSGATDEAGYTLIGGYPASEAACMAIVSRTESSEALDSSASDQRDLDEESGFAPAHVMIKRMDPNTVPVFEVTLVRGRSVSGTIEYSDGVAASDLSIFVEPDWGPSGQLADVASDGSFRLSNITPEKYVVSVYYPDNRSYKPIETIDFSQINEAIHFTLAEPSPQSLLTIGGLVKVSKEAAASRRVIHIRAYNTTTRSSGSFVSLWNYDANGLAAFELGRLPKGNYKVFFESPDIQEVILDDVKPPIDDLYVELEDRVEPELVAMVVDKATGKPITNMQARLVKTAIGSGSGYEVSDNWRERMSPEGKAVFTVTPGVYQIQVMAENYCLAVSEDMDTEDIRPVTIELTRGGALQGRVIDLEGHPVAGAQILALTYAGAVQGHLRDHFVTNTRAVESSIFGEFMMEHVPEGLETIQVVHPNYAPAMVKDISVLEGEMSDEVVVVLEREAVIEGHVFDSEGRAMAGVRLDYDRDRSGVYTGKSTTFVVTDPNGYYRIGGLGSFWYFVARDRGAFFDGVVSRTVKPECGEVTRVDFGGGGHRIAGTLVMDGLPAGNMGLAITNTGYETFRACTTTDPDGNFAFTGIIEGQYSLRSAGSARTLLDSLEVVGTDMDLGVIEH